MPAPFTLDWDTVPDGTTGDYAPLPAGPYHCAITNVELKPSGSSEFPYLNVEFTIQEGPFGKRKVWDIWSLSPKALDFGLKRYLPRLGVKLSGQRQYANYEELAAEVIPLLIGQLCVTVIIRGTWNGKPSDDVQDILPANAAISTPPAAAGKSLL